MKESVNIAMKHLKNNLQKFSQQIHISQSTVPFSKYISVDSRSILYLCAIFLLIIYNFHIFLGIFIRLH